MTAKHVRTFSNFARADAIFLVTHFFVCVGVRVTVLQKLAHNNQHQCNTQLTPILCLLVLVKNQCQLQ